MPEQQPSQPPFRGGQCEGILYQIWAEGTIGDVLGRREYTGYGPGFYGQIRGPNNHGYYNYDVYNWAGVKASFSSGVGVHYQPDNASWKIVEVNRQDGQLDICGDPPIREDLDTNSYNRDDGNNCCSASTSF